MDINVPVLLIGVVGLYFINDNIWQTMLFGKPLKDIFPD